MPQRVPVAHGEWSACRGRVPAGGQARTGTDPGRARPCWDLVDATDRLRGNRRRPPGRGPGPTPGSPWPRSPPPPRCWPALPATASAPCCGARGVVAVGGGCSGGADRAAAQIWAAATQAQARRDQRRLDDPVPAEHPVARRVRPAVVGHHLSVGQSDDHGGRHAGSRRWGPTRGGVAYGVAVAASVVLLESWRGGLGLGGVVAALVFGVCLAFLAS